MRAEDPVPGTYQNYKGAFYEVLGIADDPETGNKYVVYQAIGITENLLDEDKAGPILGHRVVRNGAKARWRSARSSGSPNWWMAASTVVGRKCRGSRSCPRQDGSHSSITPTTMIS